jgi:hypothetical protein
MDCRIKCIASLESMLVSYLEELSRVFFKKENLRDTNWWLSVFYSLWIQGFVRKVLCEIAKDSNTPKSAGVPTDQYLYLAIRLFAARSGSYDPIFSSLDVEDNEKETTTTYHIREARVGLESDSLVLRGIKSSANFLQKLFEDKGSPLELSGSTVPIDRTVELSPPLSSYSSWSGYRNPLPKGSNAAAATEIDLEELQWPLPPTQATRGGRSRR